MSTSPGISATLPSVDTIKHVVQQAMQRYDGQAGNLLPILHAIQHALGYIPATAIPLLATGLQRSRAEVHGVISFYPDFRTEPAAPVQLRICRAEACLAMGADALADHVAQRMASPAGDTAKLSVAPVYCLGLCAQSPAVELNGQHHVRVDAKKLDGLLQSQGV